MQHNWRAAKKRWEHSALPKADCLPKPSSLTACFWKPNVYWFIHRNPLSKSPCNWVLRKPRTSTNFLKNSKTPHQKRFGKVTWQLMGLAEMKGYLKNKKHPALCWGSAGCFRIMSRLSIQLHDFSVFQNVHTAFNALTAYKFTHIGAADGGMIHSIHVYGDDFGFRHDLTGF